ncbi:adenosylmethionine--8-amino-7-oxononanoate transaminase [Stakelama tenebrarum]|uniref:Adenosylmethionine-8-amino-7-oxononanoate aminotransferase n=1 Tax=Stakelama tenebrarum TaxID=2711215 RepID=A0A6G6Y713_9SPHN|nr:adenosylmethionine--8-amino-7-oxononanoate transaminase [Sphingosinithalassobacter tenebrarum]QIG80699.1 adenosylmethionine--8-amino-7-oxononanoate transaminase [Sphingosinithalassobacter tenebrarum]
MTSPVWHPFTQHGLGEPIPRIARGEGAALYTDEGRRIIDGISSWWVTTHGHCHPRIMGAVAEQTQKLDQVIFAGFTHEPAETVAAGLIEIMPAPLRHVFFSDSGSTSVEVALKMALGYWTNRGEPRHRILVMASSYHGDTVGGMSVGARGVFTASYAPLLFDVESIPFPEAGAEQATLDALEAACAAREKPAAFIVEPLILGAGGMRMYGPDTLREMAGICAANDVLLIVDEVMTGWGRTGTLLACEQADVTPDLMCLSKGLTGGSMPLAVTMATAPIFDAHLSTDKAKMFFHSSSYTANPIACAAAAANLAIWREEPVRERIAGLCDRQEAWRARLAADARFHNVRRTGTIVAAEVAVPDGDYLSAAGPRMAAVFREANVLLRPLGNTVYLMPPYCIDDADLGALHDAVDRAADAALSGG